MHPEDISINAKENIKLNRFCLIFFRTAIRIMLISMRSMPAAMSPSTNMQNAYRPVSANFPVS
jgi:hypothetical protein